MFGLKLGFPRLSSLQTARKVVAETIPLSKPSAPRLSPIASAVVLAAGAGAAFWWWTQWARGRAEAESTQADAELPKDVE